MQWPSLFISASKSFVVYQHYILPFSKRSALEQMLDNLNFMVNLKFIGLHCDQPSRQKSAHRSWLLFSVIKGSLFHLYDNIHLYEYVSFRKMFWKNRKKNWEFLGESLHQYFTTFVVKYKIGLKNLTKGRKI